MPDRQVEFTLRENIWFMIRRYVSDHGSTMSEFYNELSRRWATETGFLSVDSETMAKNQKTIYVKDESITKWAERYCENSGISFSSLIERLLTELKEKKHGSTLPD